jgi:hypothetical protein
MRRLRRLGMVFARAQAPLGRVLRLRIKLTVDNLITLAVTVVAVVTATGYQVIRWRGGRIDRR